MNKTQYCKCIATGGPGLICSICHKPVTFDEPQNTSPSWTGKVTNGTAISPSSTEPQFSSEMETKIEEQLLLAYKTGRKDGETGVAWTDNQLQKDAKEIAEEIVKAFTAKETNEQTTA